MPPTQLLPQDPITPNTVEYDFEEYALEHGIPDTLDPLPYRKAGSVFGTEEAEPVLTSAKHDPRLRTVVCRHWLRDLCMKGSACEYVPLSSSFFAYAAADIHSNSTPSYVCFLIV